MHYAEATGPARPHPIAAVSVVEPGGRMTEDARALAAENIGLARKFARDACRRIQGMWDEIDSASMLGLCQAAMTFDPSRGAVFSTFAYACMNSALMHALARRRAKGSLKMFSDYPREGRGELDPVDHRCQTIEDYLEREAASEQVRRALDVLSERERFVVQRVSLDGATLEAVGAELAERVGRERPFSRQRIYKIAEDAMLRMSRELMGTGAELERAGTRPLSEDLIPIGEVPSLLPLNPEGKQYNRKTVEHWMAGRNRGPVLNSIKIGKQRFITPRDLRRFVEAKWQTRGECLQYGT